MSIQEDKSKVSSSDGTMQVTPFTEGLYVIIDPQRHQEYPVILDSLLKCRQVKLPINPRDVDLDDDAIKAKYTPSDVFQRGQQVRPLTEIQENNFTWGNLKVIPFVSKYQHDPESGSWSLKPEYTNDDIEETKIPSFPVDDIQQYTQEDEENFFRVDDSRMVEVD